MSPDTLDALALSLRVAVLATVVNALVGVPLAYLLARRRFAGKALLDLLVTLPLARNGILAGLVLAFARALGEFGATLMLAGNIPGKTATVPLAIYTAVQTGEQSTVLVLVAILTALSCVVLVAAGRLGARAT